MKKTNYNLISLLQKQKDKEKDTQEDGKEVVQRQTIKEEADDDEYYDQEEDEGENHKPNPNYYKYKNENNCIEAYTGLASNLITFDIDYAFICCDIFIECFKTSSLCTITKNGFHFHYQYNDKLRSSRVFKHDYGFDIKNNTVVRMPPSNYNYADKPKDGYGGMLEKFTYLFFRFNNLVILPRSIINYCNNITNDKYISIEKLSEIDENKLVDKTFIKLIDIISNEKALNNDTWRQFGRICALLKYPLEYFDYFSKKENYGREDNIDKYNKIYEKAIKDLNTKNEKIKQEIEDEIRISKSLLRD